MYEKGNEPQELKKYINILMKDLHKAYPEGLIPNGDWRHDWRHESWDILVEYLYPKLGYRDNVSFLKDYGFEVFGELTTTPQQVVERK